MRLGIIMLLVLFLVSGSGLGARAQSTAAPQQADQKLTVGIAEVAVDVVVRDKQGRPVKDLTADDFEVYDEGAIQRITSSRLVTVEPRATSATPGSGETRVNPMGTAEAPRVTAVAFVFDRMSPENRVRARDAALSYIGANMKLDTFAAVYVTDLSLDVLQPLTRDAQMVKTAIERIGTEGMFLREPYQKKIRETRDQLTDVLKAQTTNAPPADPTRRTELESQLRVLESFDALQQEQMGHATMNGLQAAIDSLQIIPGRKAVMFFSEGLMLPPSVEPLMRSMIGNASSAHVSLYAIDVGGLRTESAQADIAKDIKSRGDARMAQLQTAAENPGGPMTKELERNETVLRSDPRAGLGVLSNRTGGFLIADTNDLTAGVKKIDEDLRTYYILTYAPKDQTADGRFRRIEVKVKRSGLSLQSRQGYYAVNGVFNSPVMEYETPALAISANERHPDDLKVRSAAMNFPELKRNGLVTVIAEAPMDSITFRTDEKKKTFSADFSVVVLVKTESRQVMTKLSRHYMPSGPLSELEAARKGDVLFYREADLDPGRYRVQTIVYDALGKKAGVSDGTIDVPSIGEQDLRVSDVVLIKRAERLSAEEQKESKPFYVGQMLVYPNLGEPVRKATYKQLPFFLTIYVPKGTSGATGLVIELAQGGTALGQLPVQLPAADDAGRIQYSGALPLQNIPPGQYVLKMIVRNGSATVTRSASFTVE